MTCRNGGNDLIDLCFRVFAAGVRLELGVERIESLICLSMLMKYPIETEMNALAENEEEDASGQNCCCCCRRGGGMTNPGLLLRFLSPATYS